MTVKVLNTIADQNPEWASVKNQLLQNPAATEEIKVLWALQWGTSE